MLGCFILMALLAGTAAADGPAWINGSKVSGSYDPEHNFTTADYVYAFGYLGNYSESTQAGGSVYVVEHNDTWSNGTLLEDVTGDSETVGWREDNGNFSLLIWVPELMSGKYDIVLDLDVTGCIGVWTSDWGEENITDPIWTINVTEALPGISLTKTVSPTDTCPGSDPLTVKLGDTVTYCFEVENTGNVRLEDVTIVDESLGESLSLESLDPGERTSGSITHEVTETSEEINNAEVSGYVLSLGEHVSDTDSCTIQIDYDAQIEIEKTASTDGSCPGSDPLTLNIGDTVTYCYNVTNIGSMELEIWSVVDDKLEGEVNVGNGDEGSTFLGPGDTISANRTYNVTESDVPQVTNNVTVRARYSEGEGGEGVVTGTDNCTINIEHPKTPQQVPALTPIGVLALVCLLSVVAIMGIRIRMQK